MDEKLLKKKLDITFKGIVDSEYIYLLDGRFRSSMFCFTDNHHIKVLNFNKSNYQIETQTGD